MTPPPPPLPTSYPPPLAQPPSSIYRYCDMYVLRVCELIALVTECQSPNVPPMLVSLCLCGRNFGLCLLHAFYIPVYVVIYKNIFGWLVVLFKFTHIFQLRRFADYFDLIHLTVLHYNADYCEILSRKYAE